RAKLRKRRASCTLAALEAISNNTYVVGGRAPSHVDLGPANRRGRQRAGRRGQLCIRSRRDGRGGVREPAQVSRSVVGADAVRVTRVRNNGDVAEGCGRRRGGRNFRE